MRNATVRLAQRGFTLLEIMVVVVIIGLLVAIVAPSLMSNLDTAEAGTARAELRNIGTALDLYRTFNHGYPTTQQGLDALVHNPGANVAPNWRQYLPSVPKDSWGREFLYRSPGADGGAFDLYTLGRDGREGGEGVDADLSFADLE